MKIEDIARVVHSVNMGYCLAMGDNSQKPWDQAPTNIKQSAIDGVNFIVNNPDAKPSASHENWLEFKRKEGWKYGPVKDEIKKEHPCFVPYDELPVEQKAKDYIFGACVRALVRHIGEENHEVALKEIKTPTTALEGSVDATKLPYASQVAAATSIDGDGKRTVDLGKLQATPLK